MTKEEAREILENWISEKTQDHSGEHRNMTLPIVDEIVYNKTSFDVQQTIREQWSFKGLIKFIYDLEDKC
jgi:acid stress-induced BolA-like protein IbaG/YrbA